MMRIVFLLDALDVGGAERHTIDLAVSLAKRGHDVRLIACSRGENGLQLPPELAARTTVLEHNRVLDLKGAATVAAALGPNRFQIVVAVNQRPTIIAALAKLLGAKGIFASILHTTVPMPGGWDARRFWFYRLALLGMHRLIYVSAHQMKHWRKRWLLCGSTETITNGIDIDHFSAADERAREAARRSLGIEEDDYVIGLCANFRSLKNHTQLVDAAALLRRDGIPARLLFVGDGETSAAVAAHVRERGLAEQVIFAGFQTDVRPFIAAMDVGVLCSTTETFSIAALEIMASGRPMILSDVGGASEMVSDGVDGALFPVGDTPALVAALTTFAAPAIRLAAGRAARDNVVERHSYTKMLKRYETMFDALFGAAAKRDAARSAALVQPETRSPTFAARMRANVSRIGCTRVIKLRVRLIRRKSRASLRQMGRGFRRGVLVPYAERRRS